MPPRRDIASGRQRDAARVASQISSTLSGRHILVTLP